MDILVGIVMLAVMLLFVGIALDAARRAKKRLLTPYRTRTCARAPCHARGCGQDRVDFPPGGAVPAFRHRLAEVNHVQPS